MTLNPDTIRLGYRMILDRSPSEAEVTAGQNMFDNLQAMRQAFLKSREFRRKFTRITTAADGLLRPALVHLLAPGTCAPALRDQLLALDGLQPALEIDEAHRDTLGQIPAAEQRALRYVYGDLDHGAGAGLEGPHCYLVILAEPGHRLHALWQGWGPDHSFGAFLQAALDEPELRLEVDNGQIRRLAGNRSLDGIGQEQALLQLALHHALGPNMFIGFDSQPETVITALADNGLFDGGPVPRLTPQAPPPTYAKDLAALSADQKQLFDSYTAWDGYCYTVCQQILGPDPH